MKTKAFLLLGLLTFIGSMAFGQISENYYTFSQQKTHYFDSLRAATPDTQINAQYPQRNLEYPSQIVQYP
jgi:hypothetical protein